VYDAAIVLEFRESLTACRLGARKTSRRPRPATECAIPNDTPGRGSRAEVRMALATKFV
jgi:hypothetical protein